MGYWERREEELAEDGGPKLICWGTAINGAIVASLIWGAVKLLAG